MNTDKAKEYFEKVNPMDNSDYANSSINDWFFCAEDMIRFAESYHQHRLKEDMPSEEEIERESHAFQRTIDTETKLKLFLYRKQANDSSL